ncbi:uncharacterized protein F5891DRAFT_1192387 [Suillus fuscotomentosus]|uniref:Uncharacterized protein n=1 Tax=Suillus fuscotomentosus TaxID=1912939 RepID=A0AAD4DZH4_9AGAM|nr:uncharacterized protein F5891DRAFT_1192387 [Suillus fuscotomentosus]KAG1896976.1 hypothetical protein F5891DRAFT_1192387 [Suillus fuscotomentosus]
MTQIPAPSSQTDTLVSFRLDSLIDILQGLSLYDRKVISDALLPGTGQAVAEEHVANVTDTFSIDISAPAAKSSVATTVIPSPPISAAPSGPSPTTIAVPASALVTVLLDSEEEDSSVDKDAANAAASLAEDSTLLYYHGKYFNVPIEVKAPLYYITRGRYIGVFSGWDATGPKVLGVSRAIYHKVESVEKGAGILRRAIERGEAAQVV